MTQTIRTVTSLAVSLALAGCGGGGGGGSNSTPPPSSTPDTTPEIVAPETSNSGAKGLINVSTVSDR